MSSGELLLPGERGEPRILVAAPAETALAAWSVQSVDGRIRIGEVELHAVAARDLWLRLGELLGAGDRSAELDAWAELERDLDRHFARTWPARGRTVGPPSRTVSGVVLREREGELAFRVATFAVAFLKPAAKGWEGPVFALRPTGTGHGHVRQPTGVRIRLPAEAAPELQVERQLPEAPRRWSAPGRAPELPAWLAARREAVKGEHAAILAAMAAGRSMKLDAITALVPLVSRRMVRLHLDALVELGRVKEVRKGRMWRVKEVG